jgi:acetyl coenzyme A synthetase (ADP forming)-like protein
MQAIEKLLAPKSVAIIGVSRREGSLGKMFLDTMVKMPYTGKIFPVNPKADQINNLPCFPDILSLPEVPDLAVILLPKESVLQAVQQLAQKGVRQIIVISAGFREVGAQGVALENELLQLTRANGMRMIGPNCMGLFNTRPDVRLNATFAPSQPVPGHIAFISQSGALGVAILEFSKSIQLGFSIFVSTGNKADISDVDILEYAGNDPNTTIITLYQESIDHPAELRKVCAGIVVHKPILSLKAGRTGSGHRAASSHTGALAADDIITDAFLKQCGIIRCQTLQEFIDAALAFSRQPLPAGNRVAIITNSGGPAILASDTLERSGLQLAPLHHETIEQLRQILPDEASCVNPVDMIASAIHDTYKKVYTVVEKDGNVDAIMVIIVKPPTATSPEKIIEELSVTIQSSAKPFLLVLMAASEDQRDLNLCHKYSIPVFSYPETAVVALGKMWEYQQLKKEFKEVKPALRRLKKQIDFHGQFSQAPFSEMVKRCSSYQLPLVPHIITTELPACIEFHKKYGSLVMKIANAEIIHKSDNGLVFLNLADAEAITQAYRQLINRATRLLPAAVKPNILAQQMVPAGVELVLGYKYDSLYGDVMMFGIGGVLVELYKDVVFRVLPITLQEIKKMIVEIKGQKLLSGYRQLPVFDQDRLVQIIHRFSQLAMDSRDLLEMDFNPLIWSPGSPSPIIVDGRMTIQIPN